MTVNRPTVNGHLLLAGVPADQLERVQRSLTDAFPGLRITPLEPRGWRTLLARRLQDAIDLVLVLDEGQAPLPSDLLRAVESIPAPPPVIVLVPDNVRRAVELVQAGAADALTLDLLDSAEDLREQLGPRLRRRSDAPTAAVDHLLDMVEAGRRASDLGSVLTVCLDALLQIADARAGLIALPSDETLTLGAFRGLSEDHAVLIASLEHSPLTDVLDSGRPGPFELPAVLPGDDPAAWTLSEAGLNHGIALPLLRGKRKSIRGVALLATRRPPTAAIPTLLEQASRAAAEALAVHDSLARSRDEKRSAALRLNRRTHDAAHLYRVLRELSQPRDLARVARNLSEALQILLAPDLVAVYAQAGGLRYQDLREAHPLPLRSVTAFERWFHSRILKTFGDEALEGCIPTGSSSGSSRAIVRPEDDVPKPDMFSLVEWITIPPVGPPRGAVALANVLGRSLGTTQHDLLQAMADHAARSIDKLTETLDERQVLLQSLLDGLPVGVALLDAYGRIVLSNPAGRELLSAAGELADDDSLTELGDEPFTDITISIERTGRAFSRERPVGRRVFAYSVASVSLPGPPTSDDNPNPYEDQEGPAPPKGYAIALRDVTRTHEIRKQLAQSEKLSTLGEMVSGVAHELNNPLTGIRGYTELLLESPEVGDRVRQDLDRIHRNAERCARIVADLLSFARKPIIAPTDVDLVGVMGEVLELCRPQLSSARIALRREIPSELPPIQGDAHQLSQVFINLITNARQAIEERNKGGALQISIHLEDEEVELVFCDDGPGIPPEVMPRLFDPFFTTKSVHGTGLGLSICYGIVREHGGTILAENNPESGACFRVRLPIPEEARPRTLSRELEDRAILLVEPAPVLRRLITGSLREAGYTVDVATNAEEALATLKFMNYSAILANIVLPGLVRKTLFHVLAEKGDEHARRLVHIVEARRAGELAERFNLGDEAPPAVESPFTSASLLAALDMVVKGFPTDSDST